MSVLRAWPIGVLVALASACGGSPSASDERRSKDEDATQAATGAEPCAESALDYESFGARFFLTWCTGCHSSALDERERRKAPIGIDFDTLDGIRTRKDRILARAAEANATMPPGGGPTPKEREMLAEWLACGAR